MGADREIDLIWFDFILLFQQELEKERERETGKEEGQGFRIDLQLSTLAGTENSKTKNG